MRPAATLHLGAPRGLTPWCGCVKLLTDRYRCAGDADAAVARGDRDRQEARAAELDALVDRDRPGHRDGAELTQVAPERRGRGARGRVLYYAAGRERVAGAEAVGALAVDELDRRPVAGGHQGGEAVEVVVE